MSLLAALWTINGYLLNRYFLFVPSLLSQYEVCPVSLLNCKYCPDNCSGKHSNWYQTLTSRIRTFIYNIQLSEWWGKSRESPDHQQDSSRGHVTNIIIMIHRPGQISFLFRFRFILSLYVPIYDLKFIISARFDRNYWGQIYHWQVHTVEAAVVRLSSALVPSKFILQFR